MSVRAAPFDPLWASPCANRSRSGQFDRGTSSLSGVRRDRLGNAALISMLELTLPPSASSKISIALRRVSTSMSLGSLAGAE
jgi:hypothetical protein